MKFFSATQRAATEWRAALAALVLFQSPLTTAELIRRAPSSTLPGATTPASPAPTSPSETYGAAPQSLDLYTLAPRTRAPTKEVERIVTKTDPFRKVKAPALDPQNGAKPDQILTGPALKLTKPTQFDTYRYVTYLEVEEKKERLYDLPIRHQECELIPTVFADYDYRGNIDTQVEGRVNGELLGLHPAGTPRTKPFRVQKALKATPREIADHIPHVVKKSGRGRTYIQLLNSKTGDTRMVTAANEKGLDLDRLFPSLFGGQEIYPLPVEIRNLEWTFLVEKKFVRKCTTAELKELRGAESPSSGTLSRR